MPYIFYVIIYSHVRRRVESSYFSWEGKMCIIFLKNRQGYRAKFAMSPKLRDSILTRMYLASAMGKRFKSHLRSHRENLERGKQEKKPEDTLSGIVNCLETAVLFTNSVFFYRLRDRFQSSQFSTCRYAKSNS